MKKLKKVLISVLMFTLIVTFSDIPAFSNTAVAQAATIKMTPKALSLEVGQTEQLIVKGTKKKITWSTSNKAVATVSKKGKVTAVAEGTAIITAKAAGKKLTCTVTVTDPVNPALADAPFDATEYEIGNVDFVAPSDWTVSEPETFDDGFAVKLTPNDTSITSSIRLEFDDPETDVPDYDDFKSEFTSGLNEEAVKQMWTDVIGDVPFEVTNLTLSDYSASYGKLVKIEYTITPDGTSINVVEYDGYINSCYVNLFAMATDNINFKTITDYIMKSVIIK